MVGPPSRTTQFNIRRTLANPQHSATPIMSDPPPGAWEPMTRLLRFATRPLERFMRIEAASGILLFAVAAIALIWANSAWSSSYFGLWDLKLGVRVGQFAFERSLGWVVNDGLMAIFFFVVGLEIRREVHHGELSEWRRAALPFAAALGGMLVPALVYLAIAGEGATRSGWGVAMATDIAFALGVLTLLGKRAPPALRVLLLAVAVIDDLGAIIVIALFYSSGVAVTGVMVAAAGVVGILAMQAFGIRQRLLYVLPSLLLWAGTYASGVHPTIAGVVVGMLTPVKVWLGPEGFVQQVRVSIDALSKRSVDSLSPHELHNALRLVNLAKREAMAPAESLIATLHPWVAFFIMPVFALANAGVAFDGLAFDSTSTTLMAAVGLGLVVGKPIGVLAACQLTLRLKVAVLPLGITLRHLTVLGMVAGIGFTMALFIAQLAFTDAHLLGAAKLGILVASGVATAAGVGIGWTLLQPAQPVGTAESADEAEDSTVA